MEFLVRWEVTERVSHRDKERDKAQEKAKYFKGTASEGRRHSKKWPLAQLDSELT